jgi:hypothetical protein
VSASGITQTSNTAYDRPTYHARNQTITLQLVCVVRIRRRDTFRRYRSAVANLI